MAEIKSTLDLVLERTKHLSFTEEEKTAQRTKDIQRAFAGMMQKYQDSLLSKAELQAEIERTKREFGLEDNSLFIDDVVNRIALTQDNRLALDLLEDLFGIATEDLKTIMEEFETTVTREAAQRKDRAVVRLREEHGISGSAVLPNLSADPDWSEELRGIVGKFEQDLTREKARHALAHT